MLGRVHLVHRSVEDRDLHVNHRESRVRTLAHLFDDPSLERRQVLPSDLAAGDLIIELESRARPRCLKTKDSVRVLPAASRLLDVPMLMLNVSENRLAVGNLRAVRMNANAELASQPVDDDLQVELPHPGDDDFVGLKIGAHEERWVFFSESLQGDRELVSILARRRGHGDSDDGCGELNRLENDGVLSAADRVARPRVRKADDRSHLAGPQLVDRLAIVGMHLEESADALHLVTRRVVDLRTRPYHSGVDADVGELPHVPVGLHLEGQRSKRRIVARLANEFLVRLGGRADRRGKVGGRGEIVDDRIKEASHALVLERGTTQDGDESSVDRRLPDRTYHFVTPRRLTLEELLHQRIILLADPLDHDGLGRACRLNQFVRNRFFADRRAHRCIVVVDRLHVDQVDHARETSFGTHRDHDRHGVGPKLSADFLDDPFEVGPGAVHLVDERDPRDVVLLRLSPNGLGLRLHAADGTEEGNGPVEDAQAALHFGSEVHVPRRVDDVDPMVAPVGRRGSRGDGDPALLLLDHPVHRRPAVVHLADPVALPGEEQDPLGDRRLPCINVGHHAHVSYSFNRRCLAHEISFARLPDHALLAEPALLPLSHTNQNGPARQRERKPVHSSNP